MAPGQLAQAGANGAQGQGTAAAGTAAAHVTSSILDGSCSGALADDAANLKSPAGSCPGTLANLFLGPGAVPQAGSPAIDGGPATGCTVRDPVGTSRPQGARCDIGAFELPATPLSLSQSALAFTPITIGTGSRFLTLTVLNKGLPGLTLPIAVTGASDFTLAAESCPDVLLGGASCDVIVVFTPSVAGPRDGTLQLADQTVALTGTGVAAAAQSQSPVPAAAHDDDGAVCRAAPDGQNGQRRPQGAGAGQLQARQGHAARPRPAGAGPLLQPEGGDLAAGRRDRPRGGQSTSTMMKSL